MSRQLFWMDAQLSPAFAHWLSKHFQVNAVPVRDLGLLSADDADIFDAARDANAVVVTKDSDFADMVQHLGSPPQIVWLRCGKHQQYAFARGIYRSFS